MQSPTPFSDKAKLNSNILLTPKPPFVLFQRNRVPTNPSNFPSFLTTPQKMHFKIDSKEEMVHVEAFKNERSVFLE